MNVVLCAAGSGGHIYPALRCAAELRRRRPQGGILFLSTCRQIEDTLFQNVTFPRLAVHFPRAPSRRGQSPVIFCLKIPLFLLQWIAGCMQLARTFHRTHPDIVVGFGGLSAASGVIIARCLGIPTLIHEQNAVPGLANRLAGRVATRVAVAFSSGQKYFPSGKALVCGNPVREDLERLAAAPARRLLGLDGELFTIAVTGGSQGAQFLNERVPHALAKLSADRRRRIQVVHLSGAADNGSIRQPYAEQGIAARIFEFRRDMGAVYSAADLMICRAGAMTLAELQQYGKPAVLVPYPYAAGHQRANAHYLSDQGAAELVEQNAEFVDHCAAAVQRLLDDEPRRHAMAQRCYALRQEHAAEKLVDMMEQISGA